MGPLIICGMHRSGTSLICRSLETIGLFTGQEKEHNHESIFFLTLNQWMFEQLGAGWDNTYNMRFLNEELAAYFMAVIRNVMGGPSAATYTGPDPRHRALFMPDSDIPWGWKDPRNTFTADIWTALFPDARLLHVCRNPLDVADSLRRREQEILEHNRTALAQMLPEQLDGTMQFQQSPRCFHLEEGLALWEEYTSRALVLERQFGSRAMRVRYEDFLANPERELSRIAGFAGLAPAAERLGPAVREVNPQRRYAFTHDAELRSLYGEFRQREIMKLLGYDELQPDAGSSAA